LAVVALPLLFALVSAEPAAAWPFPNQEIADKALSYPEGSLGGQCKHFATGMVVDEVLKAHGLPVLRGYGAPDGCYYGAYRDGGGVQVGINDGRPGDLIQAIPKGYRASDDPPTDGLHTAIIVAVNGPGDYQVRDSNYQPPWQERIATHKWVPGEWSAGSEIFIWRFGSVAAPPSDLRDRIAVSRYGSIWTLNPDGSDLQQRSQALERGFDGPSAWSPSHKTIAFVRSGDGAAAVWTVGAATGEAQRLAFKEPSTSWRTAGIVHLAYAPNGRMLALSQSSGASRSRLLLVDLKTKTSRVVLTLASSSDLEFSWSPDSKRMAVSYLPGGASQYDLRVFVLPTRRLSRVIAHGACPRWSPTSDRIAYEARPLGGMLGISSVKSDGSGPRRIASRLAPPYSNLQLAWSPNGKRLAFSYFASGSPSTLYTMSASGGAITFVCAHAPLPAWD
jgi:hypothetical protein